MKGVCLMEQSINQIDVVRWLRGQAREFSRIADDIEKMFSGPQGGLVVPPPAANNGHAVNWHLQQGGKVILRDQIVEVVGDKSFRKSTVAKALDVTEDVIEAELTPKNGFTRNERGWYTYQENSPE